MKIQEIKASATCAKMTEEKSLNGDLSCGIKREFGTDNTNGPSSPNLTSPGDSECTHSVGGGRLKFFKDGKFILELSHRKEGERTCWIPVHWPTVGTPRQESSTSLSVSDDNSSVQSSPWQRDHCLKQSAPVQHAAKGMEFVMIRPICLRRICYTPRGVHYKRRRPFDTTLVNWKERPVTQSNKTRNLRSPLGLAAVVQSLWEKVIRADPGIVSPRKRILRELERVTLEDHAANSKRQRPRPSPDQLPPAKPVSSHSITSILSRDDEPSFLRTLLRSPPPAPPTFLTPPSLHSLYHHPSSSFRSIPPPPASYYSSLPGYRGSPSVWNFHYPLSSLPRGSVYPGGLVNPYPPLAVSHWGSIPHQSLEDLKRDDGSSDVPLNLSKHAG